MNSPATASGPMAAKTSEAELSLRSQMFHGLTPEQAAKVMASGTSRELATKSVLFTQGDAAKCFFLVRSGRLKLTKINEQGKEIILRYIGVGELVAAMAVFNMGRYPVTAETVGKTSLISWEQKSMHDLMHSYPEIAINLTAIVVERFDEMQHRYLELCTEQVEQRIARSLVRLMGSVGVAVPQGIHIDIAMSRQDVASYSGTTVYTVSRTLSSWEKLGLIRSGRAKIIITDPEALRRLAEPD